MREADTGNYKATWKWRLGRVEWEEKWEKIKKLFFEKPTQKTAQIRD